MEQKSDHTALTTRYNLNRNNLYSKNRSQDFDHFPTRNELTARGSIVILCSPYPTIKETAELSPSPDKFIPIACRGILNRNFVTSKLRTKCKVTGASVTPKGKDLSFGITFSQLHLCFFPLLLEAISRINLKSSNNSVTKDSFEVALRLLFSKRTLT